MNIKIIIPILNPEKVFFTKNLPMLKKQSIKVDIILINSGDKIPEDLSCQIINIDKKDFNHANTRNIALSYDADYYIFMTQDAKPFDESLVQNLIEGFTKDNQTVVSYARQLPYKNANPIEVFARNTNYPDISMLKSKDDLSILGIKTFFSSDSCAAYDAKYFRKVNGFKKDLNTNEDMEYCARALIDGKKAFYNSNAKVYHSHDFSLIDIWKRYKEIGRFFKENKWILEIVNTYSKAESTGIKQALNELKYIIRYNPKYIFKSIVFSITKFVAYKIAFK